MGSVIHPTPSWQKRAAKKQQELANTIPPAWRISDAFKAIFPVPFSDHRNDFIQTEAIRKSGILTERELKITGEYDVEGLLSALADGSLTCAEVTLAYSKRAAVAQQLVRDAPSDFVLTP
jgi:amidase